MRAATLTALETFQGRRVEYRTAMGTWARGHATRVSRGHVDGADEMVLALTILGPVRSVYVTDPADVRLVDVETTAVGR